jgi:hypothetical protein
MRTILALTLTIAVPGLVEAQGTTGDIRGRLRSSTGGPVAGATITATSADLLGTRRALSAADGVYQLLALPPGVYVVRITRLGFRPTVIDSVRVQLGRTQGLPDTELEATSVQLSEVRINAPSVTLDPARTTIGATLEATDYASLPADRDYKSLISILPHVNTSYHGDPVNAGGSTGLENMYFIDGVNVTSPMNAANGTSLPYNFVRSVEVRVGGYEAQFGRALGAIVNAVTYTGTNELEANIFAFGTFDGLTASPKTVFTLSESGTASYDIGARVSGPVVRDRLWFSAAYNPRVDRADKTVTGLGTFTDKRRADVYAGKLTWLASPSTIVEASVFGDPTTRDRVASLPWLTGLTPLNADPYLWQDRNGGITAAVAARTTVGSSMLFETSVSRSSFDERKEGATALGRNEALFVDYLANTIEGGVGIFDDSKQGRTSAAVRGTLTRGQHTAVAGLEYEDTKVTSEFRNPGLGYIERQDTASYAVYLQSVVGEVHNRIPTAYLQDSWRARDWLTINAGLRWSSQYLIGASGRTAQRFSNEWQPRVGFSWRLDTAGIQRILGSYGRFFQQEPLALSGGYFVDYYGRETRYSADPRVPGVPVDAENDFSSAELDYSGSIDGLEVENFDEFTLGYERLLGADTRLTIRGVHRALRSTYQQGIDSLFQFHLGTPGKGALSFLPPPRREYSALETSINGSWRDVRYRASYVLSRTHGNYTGLYSSDGYIANPGNNGGLGIWHHATNTTGLLPNDRTHLLKMVTVWEPAASVSAGAFFTWQSGTPLNSFSSGPFGYPRFLVPRGSAGRTPSISDFNLRVAYQPSRRTGMGGMRIVVDALHLGNPRGTVRQDMIRFRSEDVDGSPANPNPDYLRPIAFQPPMTVRLGVEIGR